MGKITAVPVREFLNYSAIDLRNELVGDINVLFEDDIVVTLNSKEIIIDRYFWELLRERPLPISSQLTIGNYLTNGLYTGKTHNLLLTEINKELIYKVFNNDLSTIHDNLEKLYYDMYNVVESIYSELSYTLTEYVNSINIMDLLDIQLEPTLMESIDNVGKEMTVESIDKSYFILDDLIRNNPKFKRNPVATAYISGAVNANQMKQVLGPRGYVTELDSSIFKYPIKSSFTLGLSNLYELAADSRSGAKALYLSNIAIQDSEYFGRELQLATMTVEKLIMTDCGSTDYLDWYVKPKEVGTDGTVIYKGDLENLTGKWYLNEETNNLEMISSNMAHLYGKTIKLRSVIKCKLKNSKHVCSKCFGELSYGIPRHANLGHICSTEINSKISQSILSTKHLATSATSGDISLGAIAKKFFKIKDSNGYMLRTESYAGKDRKLEIIVTQEECFGLKDIRLDKSINTIDPGRVSRIESLTLRFTNKDKVETFEIPIKVGNRYGVFELKFLNYVIENGYSTDEYDNYIIDVSRWKYITSILKLPEIEFSFLALSKETKDMFKSIPILKGGVSKDSAESLLAKVYTLVNSKLNVNIALFEVVVYAFMVKDLANGNYDLARNSKNPQLSKLLTIIDSRSAGASYGYDNLSGKMLNPELFKISNKPDHPLDVLLKPDEVIANLHK